MAFGNNDYTTIYRDAVATFAARAVAALAGTMRRRVGLDPAAEREIGTLLTMLEETARLHPRGGAAEDAAALRRIYQSAE